MSFTDRCLCLSVMQQYIWNPNCIKSTCSLVLSDLTGILRMMSQDSMSTLLSLPSTVACDPSPLPSHRRMAPPSPAAHPAALLAPCSGLRGCCGRCPPSVIHPLGLKQEYMGPSSRQHHFLWLWVCCFIVLCHNLPSGYSAVQPLHCCMYCVECVWRSTFASAQCLWAMSGWRKVSHGICHRHLQVFNMNA